MIVYRVQRSDGSGPYDDQFLKTQGDDVPPIYVWSDGMHDESTGHPTPDGDHFPFEAIQLLFKGEAFSAFSSLAQLKKWFSEKELAKLKSLGFGIIETEASKVWDSGKQVLYLSGQNESVDHWGFPLLETSQDDFEQEVLSVKPKGFKSFFKKNPTDVGVHGVLKKDSMDQSDLSYWLYGEKDVGRKGFLQIAKFTPGGIEIYRSIRVPDYSDTHYTLDFFKNLKQGDFVVGDQRYDGIGVAWSYDSSGSHVYWSDSGTVVKMKAVAPLSSVDFEATVYLNLMNPEKEIRLKKGSPIVLKWANAATYRGKDQAKVSALSKQIRDIDVVA